MIADAMLVKNLLVQVVDSLEQYGRSVSSDEIRSAYEQVKTIDNLDKALDILESETESAVSQISGMLAGQISDGTLSGLSSDEVKEIEEIKIICEDKTMFDVWYDSLSLENQRFIDDIDNLKKNGYSEGKIQTLKSIAAALLADGKELEFVLGLLGNSMVEGGTVGLFEKYHHTYYFDKLDSLTEVDYKNAYSNKNVQELGVDELRTLYNICVATNDSNCKFGIGCIQWTDQWRVDNLVECYETVRRHKQ